jgi:hypothetical protein
MPRRRLGERRYSSYSFTTSALDGGEWSISRPSRSLPPGKGPPVPIVQEVGWAPEPVWTQRLEEKSFRLCRGSKCLRSLVFGFSTQRRGFAPMSVHEGVAVGKVALGPVSPSFYVLTCQYSSIVPPHSYIIWGIENRPIGCHNSET